MITELVTEQWYTTLIEELNNIIDGVVEARFSYAWDLIEGYHQIGTRILQENNNFERSQIYGEKIVQRVAESIGKSERTIDYAIQFAKKFPDLSLLPEGKTIHWRHIINKYLTDGKDKPKKLTMADTIKMLREIKQLLQTELAKAHQDEVNEVSTSASRFLYKDKCEFIRYLQDQFNKITAGLEL